MLKLLRLALLGLVATAQAPLAEPTSRDDLSAHVFAPMTLGEAVNDNGVYQLLNAGGGHVGYAFETEPMAPLPGFSGAPINLLVQVDLEGRFLDVRLLSHNEPIFVSGLGQAPFHEFVTQYKGHSIADSLVVGTPYGGAADGSGLVYLDGVTKATASVRIAHETILAATLQVAREKMAGVAAGPPAYPDPDHDEDLNWDDLVGQGIAQNRVWTNADVDAAFAGTLWAHDDPMAKADPEAPYLDLWVIDLGPKSIARAVLAPESFDELQGFLEISDNDEPLLVIDAARHGLVSEDFVRNTSPDWISAEQNGLPVALRDADLFFDLHPDLPAALHDAVDNGQALILRTDRRLGFDPTTPWTLTVRAVREHGVFQPEIGSVDLSSDLTGEERFFVRKTAVVPLSPLQEALRGRAEDLIVLAALLIALIALLARRLEALSVHPAFQPFRLAVLGVVVAFVGWWGQGQLSIVTPLAAIQTTLAGGSFAFLLYDPFSLLIWGAAILGLVLWGRGLFCGWLCPFGALQEFASKLGSVLGIKPLDMPRAWDRPLRGLKYLVLAALVGVAIFTPTHIDKAAEVEPFKTAITTFFLREWYYVAYAVFWLLLSMVLFKGFCRYVCPLGALLAIGGVFRQKDWIARRSECGSPCQLCRVKCAYGAIEPTGEVNYAECFQCLDCVTIHESPSLCVPQIIAEKRDRAMAAE
ncbi:MAG: 4Fe-4S binding protein [Paracoccaceae bacterium]|nr:4Fe-4S binding protein [Paracoccaceae bacterium]